MSSGTGLNVNQDHVNETYAYAANLLVQQKLSAEEAKANLEGKGIDKESASVIIEDLKQRISIAKKANAKKDMLYGAIWCIGGIAATMADIGFIFWGAIIFGGIQFFRGVANIT